MTVVGSSDESLVGKSWTTDEEGNHVVDEEWHTDHDELVAFGHWLIKEGYLKSAQDMIDYLERPWKWNTEYKMFRNES